MPEINALVSVGRFAPKEVSGLVLCQITVGIEDVVVILEQPVKAAVARLRWEAFDGDCGEDQVLSSDFKRAWRLARDLARTSFISYAEYISVAQQLMFTMVSASDPLKEWMSARKLYNEIEGWLADVEY